MRKLYLVLALSGCASAGRDAPEIGGHPDGGTPTGSGKDGAVQIPSDAAPLPDAPPGQTQLTLSQTNDMTPAAGRSLACVDPVYGYLAQNSWYRVFKLADYGVTGAFNLQRVTFFTDYAWAGLTTSQPAKIKIGTYTGTLGADTLSTAAVTPIMSKDIAIPDNTGAPRAVATDLTTTIPAGSNLIVELALPDGYDDGNIFYIGVSAGGENKKGYIRAADCSVSVPTSLVSPTALNRADNSVLISVTGTK